MDGRATNHGYQLTLTRKEMKRSGAVDFAEGWRLPQDRYRCQSAPSQLGLPALLRADRWTAVAMGLSLQASASDAAYARAAHIFVSAMKSASDG